MRGRLAIGEFATLTQLSIRTLRRYHEAGLLEPADVDPSSGYRYYAPDQIPTAQVIHRLRQLDVPLAEVKAILATADPARRGELIAGHLERLEQELARTRAAVVALRQLLRPEDSPVEVELRSVPERRVAAIAATVAHDEVLPWFDGALAELDAAFPPAARTGPAGGLYANDLFTAGAGAVTVFRPVGEPVAVGRIQPLTLPARELAVTVHPGDHAAIAETYGRLGRWVAEHALAVDGPVHETYVLGPRETPDQSRWLTEIGWPVFRVAG
jgi:DNA-binding transcriptional MerR regulator